MLWEGTIQFFQAGLHGQIQGIDLVVAVVQHLQSPVPGQIHFGQLVARIPYPKYFQGESIPNDTTRFFVDLKDQPLDP